MCGIAGVISWQSSAQSPRAVSDVTRMLDRIQHRGPDDSGLWVDTNQGVCLGQRRLSVIDVSANGHQPMVSPDHRYVLVFNGEIYNFREMRDEVIAQSPHFPWRGTSDTEVFLAYVQLWGIARAVKRSTGMFAFGIWDRKELSLTIGRDRIGEKPLYYGKIKNCFVFASELKAITEIGKGSLNLDESALHEFIEFSYIPAPRTIWREAKKLPPGSLLNLNSVNDVGRLPEKYWTLVSRDLDQTANEISRWTDSEIIEHLDVKISDSVQRQMIADVPIGAFLSGGIDSSLVVALMQKYSARPIKTFTIGFSEAAFDEAPFARSVAKHLGTDHTELYVSPQDAMAVIPDLPTIYDEPFGDSSQIPTVLLARLTRKSVTVSLSGDGGDELFAGYPRYDLGAAVWRKFAGWPVPMRRMAAAIMSAAPPATWNKLLTRLPHLASRDLTGQRIFKMASLLRAGDAESLYRALVSNWTGRAPIVLGKRLPPGGDTHWAAGQDLIYSMRRWDLGQYLPDDLMVKMDRAAMSVSLEARSPFLDHPLVEFAFAMPTHTLIRGREKKWALRQVLHRYVPKQLFDRPKMGFSTPVAAWIRGPLKSWAAELISPMNLKDQGYLDAALVKKIWDEHQSASHDRSGVLWNVLMFQAWLSQNRAPAGKG
jgi:asparagine synthase (glutamine-hydrolysing)